MSWLSSGRLPESLVRTVQGRKEGRTERRQGDAHAHSRVLRPRARRGSPPQMVSSFAEQGTGHRKRVLRSCTASIKSVCRCTPQSRFSKISSGCSRLFTSSRRFGVLRLTRGLQFNLAWLYDSALRLRERAGVFVTGVITQIELPMLAKTSTAECQSPPAPLT